MTEQFMTADETDRYIDERIQRALKPRRGIVQRAGGLIGSLLWIALILSVITVFAFAARVQYGLPIPLPDSLVATAGVAFSTAAAPLPTARPQQPPAQPIGGAAPWPTLTPEPAAQEEPTATPAPTANPTAVAHLTAIAIRFAPTETAQTAEWKAIEGPYFYDPYTLATPEAGFGRYVVGQCADQEKVKKSFLLQQMCEGE